MRRSRLFGAAVAIAAAGGLAIGLSTGSGSPRRSDRGAAHAGASVLRSGGSDAASATPAASSGASSGTAAPAPSGAAPATPATCGAASTATVAAVDVAVAQRIYAGELHSREVSADLAHVTGSRELLGALASANVAAVKAAVTTIVYTPHWHIVRLRVLAHGRVLADVGGPDVIAPVSGSLSYRGRQVGTFVMSVQDDLGYTKLVSRFTGVPIDLYRGGSFLMGTLQPAPSTLHSGASLRVAGRSYLEQVLTAKAFPSGTLQALLLVPAATPAQSARGCTAVRVAAWGSVAMHIAAQLTPLAAHYADLAGTLHSATGGVAFVRAGSRVLAGPSAPRHLPQGGTVRYAGRTWWVFSWVAARPARIYFLTPG